MKIIYSICGNPKKNSTIFSLYGRAGKEGPVGKLTHPLCLGKCTHLLSFDHRSGSTRNIYVAVMERSTW